MALRAKISSQPAARPRPSPSQPPGARSFNAPSRPRSKPRRAVAGAAAWSATSAAGSSDRGAC